MSQESPQAILGAVSNNFLQVSLRFAGDFWEITVALERENVEDEGEIEDIADEASIFLFHVHDDLRPKTPPDLCRVRPTKGQTNEGTIYGRADHCDDQGTGS
ncbi:MAG: hypothetical protein WBG95_10465, partial [Sulfitobacter sp.]